MTAIVTEIMIQIRIVIVLAMVIIAPRAIDITTVTAVVIAIVKARW